MPAAEHVRLFGILLPCTLLLAVLRNGTFLALSISLCCLLACKGLGEWISSFFVWLDARSAFVTPVYKPVPALAISVTLFSHVPTRLSSSFPGKRRLCTSSCTVGETSATSDR